MYVRVAQTVLWGAILLGASQTIPVLAAPAASDAADDVPLKPARSEFEIREFSDFINSDLSVPHPSGPLQTDGRSIRTVHGRVLDPAGQPVVGAQTVLTQPIGQFENDLFANYDKTDELGRFVLQGSTDRTRVVVRRGDGQVLNVPLEEGQTFARVEWPAPARIKVHIAPELCPPERKVVLASRKYWAGMGPLRREAVLGADGTVTFDDVLPGEFRIYSHWPLKTEDGEQEYAEREFGNVTIGAGDEQNLQFDGATRIAVRGDVGSAAWCVVIKREQLSYTDWPGYVDAVRVASDGTFLAHVPGPGHYLLLANTRPVKATDDSSARTWQHHGNGEVVRRRFSVDETTRTVEIPREIKEDPTIAAVHRILDSEPAPYASWSHTDVQAMALVRHADRAGVTAELFRILKDPVAPYEWRYPTLQAFEGMTETPEVVVGLISLLDSPPADLNVGQVIQALHTAESDLPRIVKLIIPFTHDKMMGTRWSAYYYLSRMASRHPELRSQILPTLITAMRDDNQRIREDAVRSIGWLDVKEAANELTPLLSDPNYEVRLLAARSLGQTTNDREPLVRMATEILQAENDDYEAKRAAASALKDLTVLPAETLEALRACTTYNEKPPFMDHGQTTRYQLAAIASKILKAHDVTSIGGRSRP